jgi:hypothetical protein
MRMLFYPGGAEIIEDPSDLELQAAPVSGQGV